MVCDAAALDAGIRRFVGRKLVALDGERHGFAPVSVDEPSEVEITHEIRRDCAEGMLWPADAATAAACGVKFDPAFGGEYVAAKKPAIKKDGE